MTTHVIRLLLKSRTNHALDNFSTEIGFYVFEMFLWGRKNFFLNWDTRLKYFILQQWLERAV